MIHDSMYPFLLVASGSVSLLNLDLETEKEKRTKERRMSVMLLIKYDKVGVLIK